MMRPFQERGGQVTRSEAFVDAAFAFAITLMAVAGESIPDSIDSLIVAMKGIPAFALSFGLLVRFWAAHADWSRAFGLDDGPSVRLSLLLVLLLLVFVYPLKMVFASLGYFLTGGWLPAGFAISSLKELSALFITFAVALGSMGTVMWALYWQAWRQRERLQLNPREVLWTKIRLFNFGLIPIVAAISVTLALCIPATPSSGWLIGAPGFVFFSLNLAELILRRLLRK